MVYDRALRLIRTNNIKKGALAESIGVSRSTLSNYLHGVREPDTIVLLRMAGILGVSTDYLVGTTDIPTPPENQIEYLLKKHNFDVLSARLQYKIKIES
ncbi:MAG: helix-turn-helix transcriptional regulator [Lachnospiraceae bacterium]|nr:helix-turn-helix transcriptional regulator [Lachnospiraceae bacterium]